MSLFSKLAQKCPISANPKKIRVDQDLAFFKGFGKTKFGLGKFRSFAVMHFVNIPYSLKIERILLNKILEHFFSIFVLLFSKIMVSGRSGLLQMS